MEDWKLENISEHKNLELETIHNETLRKNTGKKKRMKRVVMNCRKTFVVYHTCNWYSQWEGGQKK